MRQCMKLSLYYTSFIVIVGYLLLEQR